MKLLKVSLFLLVFVVASCLYNDDEVFIVPKYFTGYIIVIYNQEHGAPKEYNDGRRLYEIPYNGILKTQFPSYSGLTRMPEFYVDEITSVARMRYVHTYGLIPQDTVVAFGGPVGVQYIDNEAVRYAIHYIGNRAQIDSAQSTIEKFDLSQLVRK